ncbi:hypothetical protein CRG98_043597 [Punica granatum]|uniref:Uncharacterized protein n=2 Tax=Punica granatum TaxID=22663 RepID=A0A2I0HWF8_PUNGR|nr:hypothetical protein CRG98_043597 [Punica granatum]
MSFTEHHAVNILPKIGRNAIPLPSPPLLPPSPIIISSLSHKSSSPHLSASPSPPFIPILSCFVSLCNLLSSVATRIIDESVFWNGLLMDEKSRRMDSGLGLGCPGRFPSDFLYDIDSPMESALSSMDTTESGDDGPDEGDEEAEDFLAKLTRRLTRSLAPIEA